ncbi:MAG: DNA polymerase III subunit delta [Faecousia sp.]
MAKKDLAAGAFQNLKAALRDKKIGRLYFFHGEETFLMSYYLEAIKKQLLDPLTESFNFHRFTSENFDLAAFLEAVENLPMMAEYTLVQVDDIDLFKLNESERERIAQVFKDIPEYCTVIFTYLTIAWKPDKRLKKLWEAVDTNGLTVEFCKQDQRELIPWVSRHFAAQKKRISNELCAYLIDITGGTMTALSGEIQKICAYSGAEEIKKSDIDAVTEPVLDAVVFQMTDRISEGAYDRAFQCLQQLLKMQQEPLAILGALGSQFRRLTAAKCLQEQGKNAYDLQKLCGIPDYPARKTMEAARRMDKSFCGRASELVLETDYKMKTSFDDSQRLLELLVLTLAMEARHG